MAILKLRNGKHNAISATVQAIEHVPTKNPKYKDQYRITLDTGDDLYCDESATERQVERLKLDGVLDLVGKQVTFWKRAMDGEDENGKGYLNIDLGNTAPANRVAAAALNDDYVGRELRARGVPLSATTYEQIKDKYTESLGDAIALMRDAEETMQFASTPAEIVAVAATLFIERNKRGV